MTTNNQDDKRFEELEKKAAEDNPAKENPAYGNISEELSLESLEGKILHPSLDIADNTLVVGFRCRISVDKYHNIYLVAKNGSVGLISADSIDVKGEKYFFETNDRKLSIIDERWSLMALKKFIKEYPTAAITAPTPEEMSDKILGLAKKYIELEEEIDYLLLAAWIIGTYFFPIFYAFPFLNIKAPKRSGKSQCLNLLRQLCFNAVKSRPTMAALGDTVDALRGTFLIDQADSLNTKGNEELLDILADSYKKGGEKRRIIGFTQKRQRQILEYETFGPKVFASIKELPEDLRDRCIIIPLIRSDKNFPDPDDGNERWNEVRGLIYKFLVDQYMLVEATYIMYKETYRHKPTIIGRELELWLPLETIIRIIGHEKNVEKAKERFLAWYGFAEYEPNEFEESVVSAILKKFKEEHALVLSPREISQDSDLFGLNMEPRQIAAKVGWAIKKFNLASKKMPTTKHGVSYLFEKEKVSNIYDRYFNKNLTPLSPDQ